MIDVFLVAKHRKNSVSKNLKVIEHFAFARCIKLKCVDFPKSLEKISHQAFANCWDLEIVNFSSAPNVDSTAFDNCKYHFGK